MIALADCPDRASAEYIRDLALLSLPVQAEIEIREFTNAPTPGACRGLPRLEVPPVPEGAQVVSVPLVRGQDAFALETVIADFGAGGGALSAMVRLTYRGTVTAWMWLPASAHPGDGEKDKSWTLSYARFGTTWFDGRAHVILTETLAGAEERRTDRLFGVRCGRLVEEAEADAGPGSVHQVRFDGGPRGTDLRATFRDEGAGKVLSERYVLDAEGCELLPVP
jgi:hypothetical protein